MPTLTGTSGGQDVRRQAALKYAAGVGKPAQSAAPAPSNGQSVVQILQELAVRIPRETDSFDENMHALASFWEYLKQNLPQQAGPEGPAAAPGMSPAMGQMGAQAAPSPYGRPPR